MKLSKNPLTHVMLKNLYFSLDQVLDNLKGSPVKTCGLGIDLH